MIRYYCDFCGVEAEREDLGTNRLAQGEGLKEYTVQSDVLCRRCREGLGKLLRHEPTDWPGAAAARGRCDCQRQSKHKR